MQENTGPEKIVPSSLADYLEVMTRGVFLSGISWRVVEAKWPGIREAFMGFDPDKVASFGERELDQLSNDTRVIRNRRKLEAIVHNARKMVELNKVHGGFQNYLHSHGGFDGTVVSLKKEFKFLGDTYCYIFLYVVGEEVPPHEEWQAARKKWERFRQPANETAIG